MKTIKLIEAMADLKQQQALINTAIGNLQQIIDTLGSEANIIHTATPATNGAKRTYIDDSVDVLSTIGHKLHIKELAAKVSDIRHKTVPRTSIEASLIRHINELKGRARVAKVAPSTYDLPTR